MDLKPVGFASLLILMVSTVTSGKYIPRQQKYEDDYYYVEDDIEETFFPSFLFSFEPSTTRCCKVGERIAKKGMSCATDDHLNLDSNSWQKHASKLMGSKDDHDIPDHVIELLKKSQMCIISNDYFGNFKKCCHYRKNYQTALKACRKYKTGAKRRACRKQVHWQYP